MLLFGVGFTAETSSKISPPSSLFWDIQFSARDHVQRGGGESIGMGCVLYDEERFSYSVFSCLI